ncbi:MAG: HAMP domain-containing sensor histidine kinase [Flavobacteriaceae bacterium]|nr:HAMP domain-containing sensor histidine kinase [Flavobacteriaceae bacterium]
MRLTLSTLQQRNTRILVFVLVFGFIGITLWNTNLLIQRIKQDEQQQMELWGLAQQQIAASSDLNQPIDPLTFEVLTTQNSIPMIVVDHNNKLFFSNNIDTRKLAKDSIGYVKLLIDEFSLIHAPIEIMYKDSLYQKMYYGNSKIINQLRYYPIAFFLIIAFLIGLLIAYYRSAQSVVENKLWTGMAKETAHQLGTPISSLLGWLTILEQQEIDEKILSQIKSDIKRLEIISARFSKIGSLPQRESANLSEVIEELIRYMQVRMPKKILLHFEEIGQAKPIEINTELIAWVLENLIKNSIDAIRGKGEIRLVLSWNKSAHIVISDTGSGIPKNLQKKVFSPGETTKKRGWGLGLSLAKRIVEQYHEGGLILKESSSEGTAFEIQLPVIEKQQ